MKVAITGGTGFVGRYLAAHLAKDGHNVVLVARGQDDSDPRVRHMPRVAMVHASVCDERRLRDAFSGCDVVVHLAGISIESGSQTFESVHVRGTERAVDAACAQGVSRFVTMSPVRAASDAGSPRHESKWMAEEIVREAPIPHTIVKAGPVYGRGGRLLAHLDHALHTRPLFPLVGYQRRTVRPTDVFDVVRVLGAACLGDDLVGRTVSVVGPTELGVSDVVRVVGAAVGRRPWFVRVPPALRRSQLTTLERLLNIPLGGRFADVAGGGVTLPDDLEPRRPFTADRVRAALGVANRPAKSSVWAA